MIGLGAGYVDFAGSGVVHAVGGVAALASNIVIGLIAAIRCASSRRDRHRCGDFSNRIRVLQDSRHDDEGRNPLGRRGRDGRA